MINYNKEDFVTRVKDITGGRGVPVVYDSVGKDTLRQLTAINFTPSCTTPHQNTKMKLRRRNLSVRKSPN